jgi:hypothetical protein
MEQITMATNLWPPARPAELLEVDQILHRLIFDGL